MGYAIVDSNGVYANAWSRWDNPPRPLAAGESVIICNWDDENDKPVGLTMPEPPVEPDWATFRLSMLNSDAFLRIANANAALFTVLNSVMWLIAEDQSKMVETALVWNKLATIAVPTEAEIAELNGIASANNIPLTLNAQGQMG